MKKKHLLQTTFIAAALMVFLMLTDPQSISLPLILIPYLLAAILVYRLLFLVLNVWFGNARNKRRIRLYAVVLTVVTINFALLKSIGQLTVQDGLISVAIIIVSAIYVSKFSLYS